MFRGPTGRSVPLEIRGERVQAFVPDPLPPSPPLDLPFSRLRLLEEAGVALGRLDDITSLLPDAELFLYSYVRREAVLSSQIEGTASSVEDLLLYEAGELPGVPLDDVQEVSNYVKALFHGVQRLQQGFPLSNRLIREMHALLLKSGRGSRRRPGEFRKVPVWIGGSRPSRAEYIPPPPEYVEPSMRTLERFLHNPEPPALIKAALVHVQFESIHPFQDGNGRMGRLLIAFVLHHEKMLKHPLLYLSLYLRRYRSTYFDLLNRVRFEGDWEQWVDFFLEGVRYTAQQAVETAHRILQQLDKDRRKIQSGKTKRVSTLLRVFEVFSRRVILSARHVKELTGLSVAPVYRALEELKDLGILQEVTGRRRGRLYAYTALLKILAEGTEP